ncbi:MAG: carbohydrate ABC transporter permease, partial [Lachnospiraceae bacterium]|nr:carbohydrate ABC transporter permease [Lachnospiraceae bacterium]
MKKKIRKLPKAAAITIVSLISFIPFYYTLIAATHSTDEVMLGISLLPGKYLIQNISTAMNSTFWVAFKNSMIVSFSAMFFSVSISLMAGYGLAAYR